MQLKRSFLNYRSLFWRNAEAGFLIGPIAKLSDSLRGQGTNAAKASAFLPCPRDMPRAIDCGRRVKP
jgi:hypothetical protein